MHLLRWPPRSVDVSAWLREVPRPRELSAGGSVRELLRGCRACGQKALGTWCRRCAGAEAKEELKRQRQRARRSVEEVQRTCARCAPHIWRACTAAEFCPVRTRRPRERPVALGF